MDRKIIFTEKAPKPVGPYSQAVESGALLFISGQIPLDPESGKMVSGPIQDQTRRVLENVGAILEAAGFTFSNVVKTTLFLKDLSHFDAVNRIYSKYFGQAKPARSTVEVSDLPKGADIEMEAIAMLSAEVR